MYKTYRLLLLFYIICLSCTTRVRGVYYIDETEPLEDPTNETKLIEIQYTNEQIKSHGNYALGKSGKKTLYKKGLWIEYYKNGNIKEKGNYVFDSYTECCYDGYCDFFYDYKIGEWQYFYPNGNLKAKGNYDTIKLPVHTNCQGGDTLSFGVLSKNWVLLNINGNKIVMNDSIQRELETILQESYDVKSMYPSFDRKKIIIKNR